MHILRHHRRSQAGNILFLILLAIVLFVALTYAVMNQRDGKNASSEKMRATAAQIIQVTSLIENTIQRLKLTNGCKDTEISFENPVVTGYVNNNTPGDGRCKVFDKAGGGLSWPGPPGPAGTDWNFGGHYNIIGVGTSDYDLVMFVNLGGSSSSVEHKEAARLLCEELNRNVMGSSAVREESYATNQTATFTGTYGSKSIVIGDEAPGGVPVGTRTYCFWRPYAGEGYFFYHTLLAR